jgi:hypothetical protein
MTEEMTTEVAVREPMQIAQVAQLMSIKDVQDTAKAIVTSKMIAGVENESQAIVKILAGQELGLGPIASVNGLYVLNGRVGMMASVAGALLQKGGYYWTSIWDDVDNPTACEVTFYGPTLPATGWMNRFTVADAIRAKLIKTDGAHQKYPKDMLFNRAFMAGARKVAPSCLLNMGYEIDELREATAPAHLATEVPKVSAPPKPAAPSVAAPYGVLPPDVECPVHPGMFFKMNQWNKYTHPTSEKNDKGKTIWCSKEKAMPVDAPAVESVTVEQETPVAASKVPSRDVYEAGCRAAQEVLQWAAADHKKFLSTWGVAKYGEVTVAQRQVVLDKLADEVRKVG